MIDEMVIPPDGATLARSVRAVAFQARRTLSRPADPWVIRELLSAIDRLERDAESLSSVDVSRWLISLRARVEGHAVSVVHA